MNELRSIIRSALYKNFNTYTDNENALKLSNNFEEEMYNMMPTLDYINKCNQLLDIINIQYGYFNHDTISNRYITGKMTVKEVIYFDINSIDTNPRIIIKKLLISILIKNINKSEEEVLRIAEEIEKGCYNYVIKLSKQSETPPCRHWNSPLFLEMYSNRCGIVCNLLSPDSNSCIVYGNTLLQDIIDGSIDLSLIGSMTEKELCSQSIQKEKDEIALRSEQHVVEKESNLFKCPKCHERRVTYREVQLRAADEAADFICKCINCNHTFKGH